MLEFMKDNNIKGNHPHHGPCGRQKIQAKWKKKINRYLNNSKMNYTQPGGYPSRKKGFARGTFHKASPIRKRRWDGRNALDRRPPGGGPAITK
jgi:hypothetical protein